jgi:hypothetical protein
MSTRSIVAERTLNGWQGRYIHWDGYLTGVGEQLQMITARDGAKKARKTLIHDHVSWSSIRSDQTKLDAHDDPARFSVVEGYGICHSDVPADEQASWLLTDKDDHDWIEFLYHIEDDRIVCYQNQGSEFVEIESKPLADVSLFLSEVKV